ncbi:DUF2087 domain-containing protein [Curtobacterium caseinilyticum]|uniref:DUF2087 domain-containing protein n=1 Tax=Curtobacterium caseinilyticum TaxID=3055137 RepID=A0ABT7TMH5_9MICO|nr:DUF2087 domain-containing protein [Curtobacterium caseinilyticum]MDM7890782.1 DUF2087 domain-containing protein [Curtobacterium caseinilyticum]
MSAEGLRTSVGRARQAVAVLAAPTLRAALIGGAELDDRTRASLAAFDWLGDDGPDSAALGRTAEDLRRLQGAAALLEFDRIERMPVPEDQRHPLSVRIVRIVAERLGRSRPVSERELNAAIAMVCADVAIVRRDAVDLGVLERTDDGSAYRFVEERGAAR